MKEKFNIFVVALLMAIAVWILILMMTGILK